MTAERLATFTPTEDYADYLVIVLADAYDKDLGKLTVRVSAIGELSARELAVEKVRDEYPAAMAVRVTIPCPGCGITEAPHEVHAGPCPHSWFSASQRFDCECAVRDAA